MTISIFQDGYVVTEVNVPSIPRKGEMITVRDGEENIVYKRRTSSRIKKLGLNLYFGCPVKTSFSWDKTRIDFISPDIWGRAELHPAKFYEVGGQRLFPLRGPEVRVRSISNIKIK